jgi:L-rhamnonate dehydratase
MWRATINYGRKGLPIQAISAVDLAIWDVLGKLRNEPVYQLLGGKTKMRLPVYGTTARPDLAKRMGFVGAKFPLPYGPGDGDEGMRKNIQKIKEVRESVGPDFPIMVDCYMSLTVPYVLELIKRAEPYNVKWFEEFLPPDQYDGYQYVLHTHQISSFPSCQVMFLFDNREVKKKHTGIPLLTTGEHEYTRYGFRQLLEMKCADILQPDITWCGGITEARRIIALASAFDIPVIPHGSSVFSYHLQYAYPSCPMAEFLIMSPEADKIVPYFGDLFVDEPLPKDGYA